MLAACLAGGAAYAGAPSISGFVDASYNYNLLAPVKSTVNTYHGYDAKSKSFMLNAAHLALSGSDNASGLGYNVETDMGTDAAANDPNSPSGLFDVQEAYLTYGFGADKAWGLKAGKYATYEGIEVVESGSNPTISRGFLYVMAEPVTHTGAEISYSEKMWDLHVGLVNGWDLVADNNNMPTLLAKLGLNMGDPLALTVSTLIGSEVVAGNTKSMRMSFDATGVNKSIKGVDLWLQGNYGMEAKASVVKPGGDASWLGFGVQPFWHMNDNCGIGARYEYFSDPDGSRTGKTTKRTLMNISVAPAYWWTKNLMSRVEYRLDLSDQADFAGGKKNQSVLSGDLIASF